MAKPFTWQFPPNVTNSPIGPRDRGIEQYTGRRLDSLVRETIQNSLDAQEKRGQSPAKISFQINELDVASFNGAELDTALKASVDGLKSKDEAYRKMFSKAASQLGKETIPALVIADSNTTGAYDDGSDDCPWAALTRGSGESAKQGKDASGSYGIGKAAAFTATDLRTVLYTTTFDVNGHLESRFIGKAILSGHKDTQGNKVTSEGYLGSPRFSSLSNSQIPVPFQLGTQGTCLWIPGYTGPSSWQDQVVKIAIANFFQAIAKGELEVTVAGQTVNATNVGGYASLLSMREKYLLDTAGQVPVAEGHINRIGDVALRITLHEVDNENVHDVALVRDAGMMITRERSKMGPARFSVPPHWNRFTAIVECISNPDPNVISAVRDCESPKHDELDVDRIPNDEDRAPARMALRELGSWMREEIRKHAEPPSNTEPVNAAEATQFLPIKLADNNPNRKPQVGGDSISRPVQRGTSAATRQMPLPDPDDEHNKKNKKEHKQHQPPKPQTPPGPQAVLQRDTLARAKFRAGGRHSTHGLTIQIPPFTKRISDVQIQAVTEHGNDVAMKIAGVWSNGKELKIGRGKITGIPSNGKNPVTLEVNLQEPVAGRRFRLRVASKQSEPK